MCIMLCACGSSKETNTVSIQNGNDDKEETISIGNVEDSDEDDVSVISLPTCDTCGDTKSVYNVMGMEFLSVMYVEEILPAKSVEEMVLF